MIHCRKQLEETLSDLNQEHCEIVKQLVMERLKGEEVENELVRYKLLYVLHRLLPNSTHLYRRYAEAMHETQDALSSHRLSKLPIHSRQNSSSSGFSAFSRLR